MLSQEEITDRLRDLGFRDTEIETVLQDVAGVIFAQVAEAYLEGVPEDERVRIRSLPQEEFQKYLTERVAGIPALTHAEFERIHDAVWEDYFTSINKTR